MAEMRFRPLGSSDLSVSVVGVGCNAFGTRIDADQTKAVVDAAFDAGINFFDTADSYGFGESESLLGAALGTRRSEVVVATKFGMDMQGMYGDDGGARASRTYMRKAVEGSLQRLGTDCIDLLQLHTPDDITPIEETLGALAELVDEGKVRHIGCCNFAAWELVETDWTARGCGLRPFVTAQNEYSLYNRKAEEELIPACQRLGVGLLPYFPLAYGLLTGKYVRGQAAPEGSRLANEKQRVRLEGADWDRIEALEAFATERNLSLLQVAIGGLAAQSTVGSVIAGATKPEQIHANAKAGAWVPSDDDLATLDELRVDDWFSYTTFAPKP